MAKPQLRESTAATKPCAMADRREGNMAELLKK
jgi:hypothetical protein